MGFRKPLYDVEEKGLNPEVPHTNLGSDGRLLPAKDNLGTPTAVSSSGETDLETESVEVKAVPKAKEDAAKTPQSANGKKATDKEAVDKLDEAAKELPDEPKAEKKSTTKKKVTRTRKATPKAKKATKKTPARKSTTSSKSKTTRKTSSSRGRGTKKAD